MILHSELHAMRLWNLIISCLVLLISYKLNFNSVSRSSLDCAERNRDFLLHSDTQKIGNLKCQTRNHTSKYEGIQIVRGDATACTPRLELSPIGEARPFTTSRGPIRFGRHLGVRHEVRSIDRQSRGVVRDLHFVADDGHEKIIDLVPPLFEPRAVSEDDLPMEAFLQVRRHVAGFQAVEEPSEIPLGEGDSQGDLARHLLSASPAGFALGALRCSFVSADV